MSLSQTQACDRGSRDDFFSKAGIMMAGATTMTTKETVVEMENGTYLELVSVIGHCFMRPF
jgi:hypothetical protein